jgi:hypothetical protein
MNSNCVRWAASQACGYGWKVSHYSSASHHEKARGTNKNRFKLILHNSPQITCVLTHGYCRKIYRNICATKTLGAGNDCM